MVEELRCIVHICRWKGRLKVKTFYIGTENTITEERIDNAYQRALKIARWRDEMIDKHGREILLDTPIPVFI